MKPATTIDDPRFVKALSHPLRIRVMALLEDRTASPRQLADLLGAKLGVVAYHVRTLERLGMIELVDETRVRGAVEHHYRSRARPVVSDDAWEQASPIAKQAAIGASLGMIQEYAGTSAAAGGFDAPGAYLTRVSMRLDERGWEELTRLCDQALEEANRIGAEAAERLGDDPHDGSARETGFVLMKFEAARIAASLERGRGRGVAAGTPAAVSASG